MCVECPAMCVADVAIEEFIPAIRVNKAAICVFSPAICVADMAIEEFIPAICIDKAAICIFSSAICIDKAAICIFSLAKYPGHPTGVDGIKNPAFEVKRRIFF